MSASTAPPFPTNDSQWQESFIHHWGKRKVKTCYIYLQVQFFPSTKKKHVTSYPPKKTNIFRISPFKGSWEDDHISSIGEIGFLVPRRVVQTLEPTPPPSGWGQPPSRKAVGDQSHQASWRCHENPELGVSKNRGTPKWMVYNGNPYKNGWFGSTPIFGNTQLLKIPPTEAVSFCPLVFFVSRFLLAPAKRGLSSNQNKSHLGFQA